MGGGGLEGRIFLGYEDFCGYFWGVTFKLDYVFLKLCVCVCVFVRLCVRGWVISSQLNLWCVFCNCKIN